MKKILAVILLISLIIFVSGCVSEIEKQVDPCKRELEECNYECGEGILSSLCKEKCTYEYNKCKERQG